MTAPDAKMSAAIHCARHGDRAAFDSLAAQVRPVLLAYGRQWLGEGYLAEELAQETLLRAYERMPSLREPGAFTGCLMAIARNWALQRLRAQRTVEELALLDEDAVPAPDPAEAILLRQDLLRALDHLSPEQRSAAELRLVQQCTVPEAAAALGVEPEVVKGRLQRARATLRKELSDLMPQVKPEQPPLVLVVDDEHHIARLIEVNLERTGYRVMVAHDGEEALAQVRRQTPDLVTLDLMMPRMDGWTVLRHLRSQRATLLTPVLVISALNSKDPRNDIRHELADGYWEKPFSPLVLIAWADRRLRRLSPAHARQLEEWRQVRFAATVAPELVVGYLGSEWYALVQVEARVLLRELGAAAIPALAEAGREVFAEVVEALKAADEPTRATAQAVLRRVKTPEAAKLLHELEKASPLQVISRRVGEDGSVSTVSRLPD